MKAGDVVIRIFGRFAGMEIGDLATIKGVSKRKDGLLDISLVEYSYLHSNECLKLATEEEIEATGFIPKKLLIRTSEPLIFN